MRPGEGMRHIITCTSGLTVMRIRCTFHSMTLQEWMDAKHLTDADVAAKVGGLSRSQVSRIRRRVSIPSPETALKLAKLTKIPAKEFIFAERVR